MPSTCLFCDNNAVSREHLWPAWIHERKDFGAIRHKVGARQEVILPNAQQTIRCVCKTCNNGWMSGLESENISTIGLMFCDVSIPLDERQQQSLATWAVKTAMVTDAYQGRDPINRFYTQSECADLRLSRTIPDRTQIWFGRSENIGLTAAGTHVRFFYPEIPARAPAMIVTIVVGHLAMQVVTLHLHPALKDLEIPDPKPATGNWDSLLTGVWPVSLQYVTWPPKETFTKRGSHRITTLAGRWRTGEKVPYEVYREIKRLESDPADLKL